MGIKSNNLAAIYHDFFSRSGTDAAKPYVLYDPLYADDLFSTFLYDGTGAAQTITNGIDLSGEGGLVWLKRRGGNHGWRMVDTERGATKALESYDGTAEATESGGLTAFTSTGFSVDTQTHYNGSGYDMASFTFRKCPGFFDIVSYTGNGSSGGQTISHSLGSAPGSIWIKRTSAVEDWCVYHRSVGTAGHVRLNKTTNYTTNQKFANVTSTSFDVFDDDVMINGNGDSYVAYVFAHDDQSFGDNGDEAIIKCGSYTATGSAQTVNLGFEPQFLITKKSSGSGEWRVNDMMRGIVIGGADAQIDANSSSAETTGNVTCDLTPRGFITNGSQNDSGGTYIYIAIRRPHKPPEAATDVFAMDTKSAKSANTPSYTTNFPVDFVLRRNDITSINSTSIFTRLTAHERLLTDSTAAATTAASYDDHFMFNKGYGDFTSGDSNDYGYFFKRAPGFFDVVGWTGDGVTGRTVNHNLTVAPELMLVKRRSGTENWYAYHKQPGASKSAFLNTGAFGSSGVWNSTDPTDTSITLLGDNAVNGSGETYIALLFSSLDGICKVGSYTGTASTINVDCGFTNGARFVLIKRADDSTGGHWYVFDTSQGINSGNDPYFRLNVNNAQGTADLIDPLDAGFSVASGTTNVNYSGGTYLFLAIA